MNSLTNWDPFRELNELASAFRFPLRSSELGDGGEKRWTPAVDIAEDDSAYTITADLPDVKKEDVKVTFENGRVTISGERHHESEEKNEDKKFHRIERQFGSYQRSFAVPEHVDTGAIQASYKDGVLNVTLPKVPGKDEPSKIDIAIN